MLSSTVDVVNRRLSTEDNLDFSIRRSLLGDEIAELLRKAIFRGQLQPGERLNEITLAQRLNVSRAPLREAFWRLSEQGLVARLPRQGVSVTVLTPGDVVEIYDIRIPLESTAARRVVERRDAGSADIGAIERAYADMLQTSESGDLVEYLAADFRFHRTIWNESGNSRLAKTLKQVCTPYFAFSTIETAERDKQFSTVTAARHHSLLLDAIRSGTPAEAERIAAEVIRENKDVFLRRCFEGVPNLVEGRVKS
jgi:DNA-binding GntR family transcriptional regulator